MAEHSVAQERALEEQRIYRRAPCHRHVFLRPADNATGPATQALALDLSPGGLRLRVPIAYPSHASVEIELKDEAEGSAPSVALRGRIVWCVQQTQGWLCGIRLWMNRSTSALPRTSGVQSRAEALVLLAQLARDLPAVATALAPLSAEHDVPLGPHPATPESEPAPVRSRAASAGLSTWRVMPLLSLLLLLLLLGAQQALNQRSALPPGSAPAVVQVAREEFSRGFVSEPELPVPPDLVPSLATALPEIPPVPALRPARSALAYLPALPTREDIQSLLAAAEYALLAEGPDRALPLFEAVMAQAAHAPREAAAARTGTAEALAGAGRAEEAQALLGGRNSDSAVEMLTRWPASPAATGGVRPRAGVELLAAEAPLGKVAPIQIVVKLDEYLLQVQQNGAVVAQFPVGIGMNDRTPRGHFTIANKLEQPTWHHKGRGIPAGDPRNPLGAYWMGLGSKGKPTSYGIHPTADGNSIGGSQSRGCIRMKPEDAALLFQWCKVGTPVTIL